MQNLLFAVASYPIHALFLAFIAGHLAKAALGDLRAKLLPLRRRLLTASV